MFKLFIFILFVCIVTSLAFGMKYLVQDKGQSKRTVNSLTVRVVLSALLVITLVVGALMGWIKPHVLQGNKPPLVNSPLSS